MKLRQFVSLLGIVALVAIIYSPSTIGVSTGSGFGNTSPGDTSQSGTSMFLAYLRSAGYNVILSNDTERTLTSLVGEKLAYFLIGPDFALNSSEIGAVQSGYQAGRVSLLVAEGNITNSKLLNNTVGATATGAAIIDPTSPFQDKRVFPVTLRISPSSSSGSSSSSTATPTGVIDIASPLVILHPPGLVHPVATTSSLSYDAANSTAGVRTIVATGISATGSRSLVITDSAPFTNYLFNYTQGIINERAFVSAMVNWVAPQPNGITTIVLDNSHHSGPSAPKLQFGVPLGPLVTSGLEQELSGLDNYYTNFPSQVSGFAGNYFGVVLSDAFVRIALGLILLISVYASVTRWFAPEKKGNDDQPLPNLEKNIVAESRERLDFVQTTRTKSFYIEALVQLYNVLDSIVAGEFGKGIDVLDERELAQKIGSGGAKQARRMFTRLSKLNRYASGRERLLFPPVLRWKSLVSNLTRDAELFLNQLGMTLEGNDEAKRKKIEYVTRQKFAAAIARI